MNQLDAVPPVYRSWQEFEACDLEWMKSFGQERDMLDDIIAPRELFDGAMWFEEISAR
jgi:hypothetical protein